MKKEISKNSPFEILGHKFQDINELKNPRLRIHEQDVVGKYGLTIKTLIPSSIEPDPTKRLIEAVAYARDGGYKAETFEAKGTKQEILAKMRDKDFPKSVNSTFARLQKMLEDD